MSSKVKYLEASIHETVQTVQGLINNSMCLPPNNNQLHEQQQTQQQQQQQQQTPQQQTPQQQTPQQQTPQPPAYQSEQKEKASVTPQFGGNFLQNIFSNIIKVVEQTGSAQQNSENENGNSEEDEEYDDEEYEDEIEPLEITDELKEQIDSLQFSEPEQETEKNTELTEFEDFNIDELEEVAKEVSEEVKEAEAEVVEEAKVVEEVKEVEVAEDVNRNIDLMNEIEELGEIDEIDIENEIKKEPFLNNPEMLNNMTVKQLQDIAEKFNLGKRGSKDQLITKIKRNIKMS
jgi:hypothetical protein